MVYLRDYIQPYIVILVHETNSVNGYSKDIILPGSHIYTFHVRHSWSQTP